MTHAPLETAPAATTVSGGYKWAVVGMLWFICLFNYADRQAISAALPLLQEEFHFSKYEQGWITSAFMVVYALSAPIAGPVGDRASRKIVILAGLYVWSAITGFTALCSKFWQFVAVRASEGLGETFYFPASMSLISDYHGRATRSRAMSLHQTSVYAGTILGGGLAGWMGQNFGWWTPFVFLGTAGILLGLVLGTFIREPHRNEAEILERSAAQPDAHQPEAMGFLAFLRHLALTPTALLLLIVFPCVNFVAWVIITWMPTYLHESFGMSIAKGGLSGTAFIQAGSMLGALSGGVLADQWRMRAFGGRIATQALGLLLGTGMIFVCGTTRDEGVLMLAMLLFGLFKGVYDSNIWAAMYDVIPAARRSTVVGLANFVGWGGAAAGPPVIGWAVDKGHFTLGQAMAATAFIYLSMGTLLLIAALFFAPRDVRRTAATA
ncbi:MAG: MFS transporter [Planctomycetia bacterium]|nr:MFS transporter [Planctomycetia bacterium]